MSFAILKPTQTYKLTKSEVHIHSYIVSPSLIQQALSKVPPGTVVAVDTETNGTQAASPDVRIVGVGIASLQGGTHYFDVETNSAEANDVLTTFLLRKDLQFIGHNIFFDGAMFKQALGEHIKWHACTYGMYRQLANEGFFAQKWGLKEAQSDLLGWDSRGDAELVEWLVRAGIVKNSDVLSKWTPEERWEGYLKGNVRPDKARMCLAPAEILGYYCGLDAYSTLALYVDVFMPALCRMSEEVMSNFMDYHINTFVTNCKLLIDQQLRGIRIDMQKLEELGTHLVERTRLYRQEVRKHPQMGPFIDIYNQQRIDEQLAKAPKQFKVLPKLGIEPKKLTSKGIVSTAWLKWDEKRKKIEGLGEGEVSKSYTDFLQKIDKMVADSAVETGLFNIGSGAQRRWLLYDCLKFPVHVKTPSDLPATDKKALPGMGEVGQLLMNLDKQRKLIDFVHALQEITIDGVLHPQFKVPGTYTGRLGGSGGFNLQNIPKRKKFAELFIAREGYVWVDLDFASLEQVVLAELSRDPSLLALYAPGAKANDVYLFVGSQLPVVGPKILAAGYDPKNPTQEGIDSAKKLAKKERDISKTVVLGASYGAGPKKIRESLGLSGINLTFEEAGAIHRGYWKVFAQVKDYEAYLLAWWERTGGWVLNGIGRPICCDEEYKKDIVNRVIQSTGHDCLMMYIETISELVSKYTIEAHPVLLDSHDATTWECKEEDAQKLKDIFEEALVLLNQKLLGKMGLIPLKGDAAIVRSLAEAKGLKDD